MFLSDDLAMIKVIENNFIETFTDIVNCSVYNINCGVYMLQ